MSPNDLERACNPIYFIHSIKTGQYTPYPSFDTAVQQCLLLALLHCFIHKRQVKILLRKMSHLLGLLFLPFVINVISEKWCHLFVLAASLWNSRSLTMFSYVLKAGLHTHKGAQTDKNSVFSFLTLDATRSSLSTFPLGGKRAAMQSLLEALVP